MLTDPSFVELTIRAVIAFRKIVDSGPADLIPCFFQFRQMLHTHDGEVLSHQDLGIELGWREPKDVPKPFRGSIGARDCGFSFGAQGNGRVLVVDHDGHKFVLV